MNRPTVGHLIDHTMTAFVCIVAVLACIPLVALDGVQVALRRMGMKP